ncbi:hypothetical protein CEXT_129481 [Caerostris extrusa]|uniref:Uncharacterized protein n=1 Tax=Caerostris extrusa TaxID=172846 RepID=A0AAV4NIJ7_CAEEX|nr:hypothetical protein CEXT_129481 [Caerostris extrusa]
MPPKCTLKPANEANRRQMWHPLPGVNIACLSAAFPHTIEARFDLERRRMTLKRPIPHIFENPQPSIVRHFYCVL